jgi:hypothetical protein
MSNDSREPQQTANSGSRVLARKSEAPDEPRTATKDALFAKEARVVTNIAVPVSDTHKAPPPEKK